MYLHVSKIRDADPGSGAFLTPVSGMEKHTDPGSGINISDHISDSLGKIVWFKNN
jgi:hypothetical protein